MKRNYAQSQARTFKRDLYRNPAYRAPTEEDRLRAALMRQRALAKRRAAYRPANLRSFSTELKAVDIASGFLALNTTGSITPINLVQSGSGYYQRIGRKISMVSLHVKGAVLPTANNSNNSDYLRILVIYDRQTNAALPAMTAILQTTTQAGVNSTTSMSGLNLNNRDRFTILRDVKIVDNEATNTAGVLSTTTPIDPLKPFNNIEFFIKLKGLVTQYGADSSPAVIGDINTGALYLVTLGINAAGNDSWQFLAEMRLRYADV